MWLGVTGLSPLLRAYPSSDLDWMWSRDPTALNSFLMSASLAQDLQGNLVAVRNILPLVTCFTSGIFQP